MHPDVEVLNAGLAHFGSHEFPGLLAPLCQAMLSDFDLDLCHLAVGEQFGSRPFRSFAGLPRLCARNMDPARTNCTGYKQEKPRMPDSEAPATQRFQNSVC